MPSAHQQSADEKQGGGVEENSAPPPIFPSTCLSLPSFALGLNFLLHHSTLGCSRGGKTGRENSGLVVSTKPSAVPAPDKSFLQPVSERPAEPTPSLPTHRWEKIPHVTGLYRHTGNGNYLGSKKVDGKKVEKSLRTTDRKIAERKLAEWFRSLTLVNRELERTTLDGLINMFLKTHVGKSVATQKTNLSVIAAFKKTWSYGLDIEVRHVRPSQLDEWLAKHERRLKNTSYNRYAGFLKQLFEIAVKDRIIVDSPFKLVTTRWKRPQKPVRRVPTIAEFEAIVASIRTQPFSDHAEATADFIEFLGLAGLGQAEASALTWGDINWDDECISVRRVKTDTRFSIPIYSHLRPLLLKLRMNTKALPTARVLKIKDGKKALATACRRLKLPHFTQRNIRQCLIRRLWQAGVDRKLIAKWQGHQDGGQLVMDTYTEVFGSDDLAYERQQLAKLLPSSL